MKIEIKPQTAQIFRKITQKNREKPENRAKRGGNPRGK